MKLFDKYVKRINGTFAKSSFAMLADDLDADDNLEYEEKSRLKTYALYKYRAVTGKKLEFKIKGVEGYVRFGEDEKGKVVARIHTEHWDEDDESLLDAHNSTIWLRPGLEIRIISGENGKVELFDMNDKLLVVFTPLPPGGT